MKWARWHSSWTEALGEQEKMWSEARLVWAIPDEELHLGSFGNRDPVKLRDTSQFETPKVSLYVIPGQWHKE